MDVNETPKSGKRAGDLRGRWLRLRYEFGRLRVLMRFLRDRAAEIEMAEVSSSMALATLLAIVPVLALSLALFAAFPTFADARLTLEDLIVKSFLPEQYSAQLLGYIRVFTEHAAGLTTFGLAGLALTTLLLIDKIFVTINRIFDVRQMRRPAQRALIYWALLTLGPLAIAASLTMTGRMVAQALSSVNGEVSTWLYSLGQILLQSLSFAFIYAFVPACRVRFLHALAGGVVAALAGQIVKQCFEYYVSAGTLSNIYGAFVALPVLILWIYIAWFLFFMGAAITATIPKLTAGRMADTYRIGNDLLSALVMVRELTQLRLSGEAPVLSISNLCDAADVSSETARRILDVLQSAGYVAPIADGGKNEDWVLVADSQRATLRAAFEAFAVDGKNSLVRPVAAYRAASGEATGSLSDLWLLLTSAAALRLPLAQLFAPDATERLRALAQQEVTLK